MGCFIVTHTHAHIIEKKRNKGVVSTGTKTTAGSSVANMQPSRYGAKRRKNTIGLNPGLAWLLWMDQWPHSLGGTSSLVYEKKEALWANPLCLFTVASPVFVSPPSDFSFAKQFLIVIADTLPLSSPNCSLSNVLPH